MLLDSAVSDCLRCSAEDDLLFLGGISVNLEVYVSGYLRISRSH